MSTSATAEKPVFGYWAVRGIVEPIRCLLHYTGIEYEDKKYQFGSEDPTKMDEIKKPWMADKQTNRFELDFPNLPYWIEGDLRITQSITILRHIARITGMTIQGDEKKITMQELVEQQAHDLRLNISTYAYGRCRYPNYPEIVETILEPWNKFLTNKKWLLGEKLTYVDFMLYDALDMHQLLKPGCLNKGLDNLLRFYNEFKNIPKIKQYHQSSDYISWPITSPVAKNFGYHSK